MNIDEIMQSPNNFRETRSKLQAQAERTAACKIGRTTKPDRQTVLAAAAWILALEETKRNEWLKAQNLTKIWNQAGDDWAKAQLPF